MSCLAGQIASLQQFSALRSDPADTRGFRQAAISKVRKEKDQEKKDQENEYEECVL